MHTSVLLYPIPNLKYNLSPTKPDCGDMHLVLKNDIVIMIRTWYCGLETQTSNNMIMMAKGSPSNVYY